MGTIGNFQSILPGGWSGRVSSVEVISFCKRGKVGWWDLFSKYKGMLAHKLNSNERKTQGGAVDEHFRGIINVCKGSVNYSEKIY